MDQEEEVDPEADVAQEEEVDPEEEVRNVEGYQTENVDVKEPKFDQD